MRFWPPRAWPVNGGPYQSYSGSKWDRGLLPIDTLKLLAEERGSHADVDMSTRLDWQPVREAIAKHGMRNSNVMAIAPTATISNISGVTQSIEPMYRNLYVKANLSGDFTVLNPYLVNDLKSRNLWDDQMVDDLKYFDGSVQEIDRVPAEVKALYKTAFEVAPEWLIECASRRQKWIDMGQSLNLYIASPSGKALDEMYKLALGARAEDHVLFALIGRNADREIDDGHQQTRRATPMDAIQIRVE